MGNRVGFCCYIMGTNVWCLQGDCIQQRRASTSLETIPHVVNYVTGLFTTKYYWYDGITTENCRLTSVIHFIDITTY